ncbi:MAG: cytochrome b N-terminal domain-containing protein [Caldimicrobium sp.]|nr:cytochrome b N-terminal domain-containing protein [Caldimicrobium sp.]MCX7613717.1 cytochrome b N-terminal domain-containing protein [Caldimicrobium sp.]MDW8183184.1 cytochrome b N-terminal domain-containing protein [Caldimicrobium sp.]
MIFRKGTINFSLALIGTSSLLLCILSGIPLSFHFFYSQPLVSILHIESHIPFGKFLRNLHYLSAQVSLIAMFLHLVDSIMKELYRSKTHLSWFFLTFSLFLLLFITFTGYLLRADEVGELAGAIVENLFLSVPWLGEPMNNIFFAQSKVGLIRVYHWHLILSFFLVMGVFIWHVKIKSILRWDNLMYFLSLPTISLLFEFPLVPFHSIKARGPWFFVGAQEMLKYLDPIIVLLFLMTPVFLLLSYSYLPGYTPWVNLGGLAYLALYLVVSLLFFLH